MAGKFLSLEEAAHRLGVSIDEINRLVDRKKLFPMRDGATVKFKADDIERAASDLGDEASSGPDDLALDLDLSSPGLMAGPGSPAGSGIADDEIVLGDVIDEGDSIFGGGDAAGTPSRTIIQDKGDQGRGDHAVGGEDLVIGDAGSALASSDLELDSIIGASSPSLARGPVGPASGLGSDVVGGGSGTLAIDLSNLGSGSIAGLSGPAPGAALSGAVDSGLSLEGADLAASGVSLGGSGLDLGGSGIALGGSDVSLGGSGIELGGPPIGSGIGSGVDAIGGGFGGDAFDLGASTTDDESASVVIATEDSGDSSFFGAVTEDSGSVSLDDAAGFGSAGIGVGDEGFLEGVAGPPFSVLQIVGLVCCTLFLLTCSLVMIDLVWSIQAPVGEPISSPLLKALTDLFSWR